jgi:hypothetical protein
MVSIGMRDFLTLLLVLADHRKAKFEMMFGRCPDCWRPISAENPSTMIGELLAHELQYHPEHANTVD